MADARTPNKQDSAAVDYDLTCWYLNQRRVLELVGADSVAPWLSGMGSLNAETDPLWRMARLSVLKDALVDWMRSASPPTLGQLLITDTLKTHSLFTLYSNFHCRGLAFSRAKRELKQLRAVPERAVKGAFAEIIGEPTVPKDWGGERPDLFTSRVVIDGERISAAFAFKGPAEFKPLTLAGLGKNGDQIDRLFSEPADLLVFQHCHEITPPVRATMRAYAQQIGNPRLFCLIDGYDTARLFRAYGKCGF